MTGVKLCDKDECTGCLACYNACPYDSIIVKKDSEGFVHPEIKKDACQNCGKCKKSCPILNDQIVVDNQIAFKAWACDEEILKKSSSGGAFSILSRQVISKGGYVYGAAFDEDFQLKHLSAHTESELEKLRGSKYLQSFIGKIFVDIKQKLGDGIPVLFCGTPCQVAGLNMYLGRAEPNLITIDLVCHGVPSPQVFSTYKKWLEKENKSAISSYSFRDKQWSWYRYNTLVTFADNTTLRVKFEDDPWMQGFLRNYFLRPSCHHCKFANMNRQSDITLADYWANYCKWWKGEKDNRDSGCSLILLNTVKGRKAFEEVKTQMNYYPISIDEVRNSNKAFNRCFSAHPNRAEFWKDYHSNEISQVVEKYMYPEQRIPLKYQFIYKYGKESMPVRVYDISAHIYRGIKHLLKILR